MIIDEKASLMLFNEMLEKTRKYLPKQWFEV
jgi:hypothetical protein